MNLLKLPFFGIVMLIFVESFVAPYANNGPSDANVRAAPPATTNTCQKAKDCKCDYNVFCYNVCNKTGGQPRGSCTCECNQPCEAAKDCATGKVEDISAECGGTQKKACRINFGSKGCDGEFYPCAGNSIYFYKPCENHEQCTQALKNCAKVDTKCVPKCSVELGDYGFYCGCICPGKKA